MNFEIVPVVLTTAMVLFFVGHFFWTLASPNLSFSRVYHIAGIMAFSAFLFIFLDKLDNVSIERASLFKAVLTALAASIILVYQLWSGMVFDKHRSSTPVGYWMSLIFLSLFVLISVYMIRLELGLLFPETAP